MRESKRMSIISFDDKNQEENINRSWRKSIFKNLKLCFLNLEKIGTSKLSMEKYIQKVLWWVWDQRNLLKTQKITGLSRVASQERILSLCVMSLKRPRRVLDWNPDDWATNLSDSQPGTWLATPTRFSGSPNAPILYPLRPLQVRVFSLINSRS